MNRRAKPKNVVFLAQGPHVEASPLAFHLLKGFVQQDAEIRKACKFDLYNAHKFKTRRKKDLERIWRLQAEEVMALKPDLLALSLYVWNTTNLLKIAQHCKRINPKIQVLVGGPDTYGKTTAERLFKRSKEINFVIASPGGGELAFLSFLQYWALQKHDILEVPFLTFRAGKEFINTSKTAAISDLDSIPSAILPYKGSELKACVGDNGLPSVVIETSRGCPIRCSFCQFPMSSGGMKYFSIDRVISELEHLRKEGIKFVYFADGIFTLKRERALAIFKYFLEVATDMGLHCEVKVDILHKDLIPYVRELINQRRLHIGVGVQSTHAEVLKNIGRNTVFSKLEENAKAIFGHAFSARWDLIYGLPGGTFEQMLESMDYIQSVMPGATIQLHRLQILPGTPVVDSVAEFDIVYDQNDPYHIISTATLSPSDIQRCQFVAELCSFTQKILHYSIQFLDGVPERFFQEMFTDKFFSYTETAGWNDWVVNLFEAATTARKLLLKKARTGSEKEIVNQAVDFCFLMELRLLKTGRVRFEHLNLSTRAITSERSNKNVKRFVFQKRIVNAYLGSNGPAGKEGAEGDVSYVFAPRGIKGSGFFEQRDLSR